MKRLTVLLLCFCLLCTACGTVQTESPKETAAPIDTPAPEPTPELTAYQKDYERLWDLLENSYPYLPYFESEGIDVSAIRAQYAETANGIDSDAAFIETIQSLFAAFDYFGHLYIFTPRGYQSLYSDFFQDEELSDNPYYDSYRALLSDPRLSPLYQVPSESMRSDYADSAASKPFVGYYKDCKAIRIHITSFSQVFVQRDRDLIANALAEYPDVEHLIIDITGNDGGSDYYWMNNLVAPFGGSYTFDFRMYLHDTPEVRAFLTDEEYASSVPVSDLSDVPEWVGLLRLDRCLTVSRRVSGEQQAQRSVRRWLVVDEDVFSAADTFAQFCKRTDWATVVGNRTSGDGLGGAPGIFLLENTGLLVMFCYDADENEDGTINAVNGTAPDYVCINQSPMDLCLQLIREGN